MSHATGRARTGGGAVRASRATGAVLVALALVASVLLLSTGTASAATPTTTTLTASPSGGAVAGQDVILTATVTPADAPGYVKLTDETDDGVNTISSVVPVIDGVATFTVSGLAVGDHSFVAMFDPNDLDAYDQSFSTPVEYEVGAGDTPVITCVGADDFSRGILQPVLAPTGGRVTIPTPVDADVPAAVEEGGSGDVDFEWIIALPPALVSLAESQGADWLALADLEISAMATEGGVGSWVFPEGYMIDDLTQPAILTASGSVTADGTAGTSFDYTMTPETTMTIQVSPTPAFPGGLDVFLDCEILNNVVGTTNIVEELLPPGAPTDVVAEGGPLQASVTWAPPGDPGSSPITGYEVTASPGGTVTATSAEVTTIQVIGLTAGEDYTFTVRARNDQGLGDASEPSDAVAIEEAPADFSDVPPGSTFYKEIMWMVAEGITTGVTPDTFNPGGTLTRQAMSAFLYRLAGEPDGPDPECTEQPFTDVLLTNPFCGEIAWMKEAGISTGNADGTFGPAVALSRQAMSAFLYRLAGEPDGADPVCTSAPFNDVPTTNPFCGEIAWMKATGISVGNNGNYLPTQTLTRQAMSAFLYRFTLIVPSIV